MRASNDLLNDPEACWSRWRPARADRWDEAKAAHLHRRAGFGATWGQVLRDKEDGFERAVRRVLDGDTHGPDGRQAGEIAEIADAMVSSARREPSIDRVQYLWFFRASPRPARCCSSKRAVDWAGAASRSTNFAP